MATGGQSFEEVKRVTSSLEISPSKNDSAGLSRAPKVDVTGRRAANAKSYTLSTDTSEAKLSDRGRPLPNFQRDFSRRARREGPGRRGE